MALKMLAWGRSDQKGAHIGLTFSLVYGFESSNRAAVIERNRTLVAELKTQSGFLYKVCYDILTRISFIAASQTHPAAGIKGKGFMQNRIIQKLVNSHWFKDRYDVGPIFEVEFAAFPEAALVLLFTAVCDLWLLLIPLTHSSP
jgi:hypothetical protein